MKFILYTLMISLFFSNLMQAEKSSNKKKPNIVFILADDLGYGEVGVYGQTKIKTPNLDKLAKQGVIFTNHYSGAPVCGPARCVLMTGKHLAHAQVRGNKEYNRKGTKFGGQHPLKADTVTIAKVLKKQGYTTGAFGKWGLGHSFTSGSPLKQGFDRFYGYNCQRNAHSYYPEYLDSDEKEVVINKNPIPGHKAQHTGEVKADTYRAENYAPDLILDEAVKFIDQNKNKPFFLYLPFVEPHVAIQSPQKWIDTYPKDWDKKPYRGTRGYLPHPRPRAAYAAMVSDLDEHVGTIMQRLKKHGLDKNTIVIFTSDNGPTFNGGADSKFFNSTAGLRGLKGSVYEGGLRVPTIVKWSGQITPNSQTSALSYFPDWFPTIASMAGVKNIRRKVSGLDGLSLVKALQGKKMKARKKPLIWEFREYGGLLAIREGKWKLIRRKLLSSPTEWELYNIENDEKESNNLASKHPEIVKSLKEKWLKTRTINQHFTQPHFDKLTKKRDESKRKIGGSFVKTTKSYRPSDINLVHSLKKQKSKSYAWRGERLNYQILLWTEEQAVKAKVKATSLKNASGQKISAKNIKLNFLKFIKMNTRDAYARDKNHVEMVPDMLNGSKPISIPAGQVQPLWVGVDIPRKTKSGIYKGNIVVTLGAKKLKFPLSVEVLPLKVPKVKDWKFDLTLWTHPQAALHYYSKCKCKGQDEATKVHHCQNKMWSKEHFELYKPTLKLLRNAGLRTITVNLIENPWLSSYNMKREQVQTNYPYDEMIIWRRKKNGSFTFDFKHFENYVKFCMDLGIDKRIECFSMLPWITSKYSAVTCFDEASNKKISYHFKSWDEYNKVWTSFMDKFVPVLIKNGWFHKTRFGVDERGLKNIPHVQKILSKYTHKGKKLLISCAAAKTHSFDDDLEMISMHGGSKSLANNTWKDQQFADWADSRRKKGLKSTWYTCTGTYPGNFGNSRPGESLYLGWYSAKIKADGYLRWAVDSWNDNPTETTDHKVFETGDLFQIYPGDHNAKKPFVRSSVRFELFRQGIVDYEKLLVLKKKYPKSKKAITEILAKITRPHPPKKINGHTALEYKASTEEDFSKQIETARQEFLRLTLETIK